MSEMPNSDKNENNNEPKKNGSERQPVPEPPIKLRFDPQEHDQKIEARMSEEAKSKCRALISRAYLEWKRQLERRIKQALRSPADAKKQLTQQDIIRSIYDLHGIVAKEASTPEMYEWRAFTMGILEDLISQIVLTNLKSNLFTEFIPEVKTTESLVIPQRHAFETFEEFEAIPFLKQFKDKEGFIGFIREQKQVLALYEGGEITMAGVVASSQGVEKLPTRLQMAKELERSEQ